MKVAAIVPAYNEEKNIANVLRILLESPELDEIILMDDGSKDNTAKIGKDLGVRVITNNPNKGKGEAMRIAVESTTADIIAFFDADLINFQKQHISDLIWPVKNGHADMCVGLRGRAGGLPKLMAAIAPIMFVIGGERAMKREVFLGVPKKFIKGFSVEIALNYYCRQKKLKVMLVELKALTIIRKEQKMGFIKGFTDRVKMIIQLIKIRIKVSFSRKEFK
jgi:glycosyltransferase involved in cell wall biosynthesis